VINPEELGLWSRFVHDSCGVYLDQAKSYLIETRLQDLLKETHAAGFSDLYYKVRSSPALQGKVVDAITTNETSFFRDISPFELLRHKLLPELFDRRNKSAIRPVPVRIWSAACSTGQEVYTVAMIVRDLLGTSNRYDVRILGTDISNRVIAAASRGEFSELELQRGLASDNLNKHFNKTATGWKIRDEIRGMVSFRTMNLLQPFSFPAPYDIVLCRNVAIYFTEENRARLFHKLGQTIATDGALIVGSTESLTGLCPEFEPKRYVRAVYYQLRLGS
jgi:chemotaxis protein methyltransferase CheR